MNVEKVENYGTFAKVAVIERDKLQIGESFLIDDVPWVVVNDDIESMMEHAEMNVQQAMTEETEVVLLLTDVLKGDIKDNQLTPVVQEMEINNLISWQAFSNHTFTVVFLENKTVSSRVLSEEEENTAYEVTEFIGSRYLSIKAAEVIEPRKIINTTPMYRGMMFPKPRLKEGYVLEEWNDSMHWSVTKQIAINFAKDGYIPEGFFEEKEFGDISDEEVIQLFVPVIFQTTDAVEGYYLPEVIKLYTTEDRFLHENELLTMEINFEITTIEKKEGYYLVTVKSLADNVEGAFSPKKKIVYTKENEQIKMNIV